MDKRNKNCFGLDRTLVDEIDWDLACRRVLADNKSDFIYAPHITAIFQGKAKGALIEGLKSDLYNGSFSPAAPITIEVPKASRMHVAGGAVRGPTFSRPGSILLPRERIFYQALSDKAAIYTDIHTDRSRCFSHVLAEKTADEMFRSPGECWKAMRLALTESSESLGKGYIVKTDVSNYFMSINQHVLVNYLESIGYPTSYKNCLDSILVLNTGDRNSRGLLQGLAPSDLFGDFYLTPLDRMFSDMSVASVRYVDDIYIFCPTMQKAESITQDLTRRLRDYDLSLNEAKSKIIPREGLVLEEPDLEALFQEAVDELEQQKVSRNSDDYSLQITWPFDSIFDLGDEVDETDDGDEAEIGRTLTLGATEVLFDRKTDFPGQIDKIERFCLPTFSSSNSDYAVDHVLENFDQHPAMTQVYCTYLAKFIDRPEISTSLLRFLNSDRIRFDWQKMWIIAALMRQKSSDDAAILQAIRIYKDSNCHDGLRSAAALLVSAHGSFPRQKELADEYSLAGSNFLQTSLLFGTQFYQKSLRVAMIKAWSGHSPLHELVAASLKSDIN